MLDLGKELARLRKEKRLIIKALAELAGTKPKYIGDLEHGKLPGIEVASKLAKVLDVSLDDVWIKKDKQKDDLDTEKCDKNYCWSANSPGLEILNLSPRSFNALYGAKIETVVELLLLSEKDLSTIRGLGPASQREVKTKLRQYSPPRTDTTSKTDHYDKTDSVDN